MAGIAKNHDYHMVEPSPWPFVMSVAVLVLAIGAISWMHDWTPWVFFVGLVGVLYTMYAWWSDVIKEANQGDHTPVVQMHHRYGMMLFIASEVMVFFGFFWAYFDGFFRLDDVEQYARVAATSGVWPPTGVELFDPFHLPLFNTLLLLTSGTTVTWAHHALLEGDREGLKWGLVLTVLLGAVFLDLLDQLLGRKDRPAGREEVVADHHRIPRQHRIDVNLQRIGAVLQRVFETLRGVRQLAGLADRHERSAEPQGEGRAECTAALIQQEDPVCGEHDVGAPVAVQVAQGHLAERDDGIRVERVEQAGPRGE